MTMICIALSQDSLPRIVTLRDDTAGRISRGVQRKQTEGGRPCLSTCLLAGADSGSCTDNRASFFIFLWSLIAEWAVQSPQKESLFKLNLTLSTSFYQRHSAQTSINNLS